LSFKKNHLMKKLLILSSIFISATYFAQTIEGQIIDNKQKSISYLEISLKKGNDNYFSISNANGNFKINAKENGEYLLEVFQDGNNIFSEKINLIGTLKKNINISPIKETEVEAVSVIGKKKLIERKVDRLVFNIENSVAAQGLDLVEALGKTPMLRTTDKAFILPLLFLKLLNHSESVFQ